jgi:hypothetical protein
MMKKNMKKMFRGERGAVTVFLVIILVPCIVMASLFVDLSRLKLARSLSASSADLALNSVLTQYDPDLKRLYGLMASSKNMKDVRDKATKYYKDLLQSQGLPESAADSLSARMGSIIDGEASTGDVTDLLRIEPPEGDDSILKEVEGANLTNPTLMRNQIVEFMKYRAPIDISRNIFELFQSLSDSADDIKDSKHDELIIDKKKAFYESLGKLIESLKKVYDVLKAHENSPYFNGSDTWSKMKANVNSEFEGSYRRDVHETLIKYALENNNVISSGSIESGEINRANETMASVNASINKYLNDLTDEEKKLNDIKGEISGIYQKAEDCRKKKEEWRTEAKNGSSTLAKEDLTEIEGLSGTELNPWLNLVEKMCNGELSPSDLYILNDKISGTLKEVKNKIDAMEYGTRHLKNGAWTVSGSKKLKNLSSLSGVTMFISLTYYKDDLKVEDMTKEEFDAAIDDRNGTFHFVGAGIGDESRYRRDSLVFANNPLYKELNDNRSKYFSDGTPDEASKKTKDHMEERAEEEKKNSGDAEKKINKDPKNIVSENSGIKSQFPSNFSGGSTSLFGSFVGLVTNFADKGLEGGLLNMRDALYSAEYAKGMFSYYTIEDEETKYRDISKKEQMKSLTLTPIDAEHNFSMYGELEYILYGKGGKSDIVEASKDIYAIRLILNIPSAFLTFYTPIENEHKKTGTALLELAKLAQAATAGIVPYPVFQIVFILALAAVETGIDLMNLLAGHAVDLFKGSSEKKWTLSFERLKSIGDDIKDWNSAMPEKEEEESDSEKESNLMDTDNDGKEDVCLFYSDYLYLFLLIGYNADKADSMYKRTADLIQANIMHQGGKDFRMSNAHVYYRLKADLKVSPLMLALPIADEYTPDNIGDWQYWRFKEDMVRGYQ